MGNTTHDRDSVGICRKCGRGITAHDLVDGEQPCRTAVPTTTRTVYSVQAWSDVDSVRDSWITGYGYYTHSREDAAAQLEHDRKAYPHTSFRLATAEITEWEQAQP